MRLTITNLVLLVLLTIGLVNAILWSGDKRTQTDTGTEFRLVDLPPMHIRQIAHMMDMGHTPSDAAMMELGEWMEENPDSWNRWCQWERRTP